MSPLPDEHRALLAKEKCIRGPLMPERRARGRLPKIDPLPYDIATACYAIGTRVEVPSKRIPYFKPSKELKDLVNQTDSKEQPDVVSSPAGGSGIPNPS